MQFRVLGKPVCFIRVEEKLGFGKAMEKNAQHRSEDEEEERLGACKSTACPHVDVETCLMERYFQ